MRKRCNHSHRAPTNTVIPDRTRSAAVHSPPAHKQRVGNWQHSRVAPVGGLQKTYKRVGVHSRVSSAAVQLSPVLPLPTNPQARCRYYLFFLTTHLIVMFPKATLTFLVIGALSVNALAVPVAHSPSPEPECEFPRSFSTMLYSSLTFISFSFVAMGPDPA